MIDLNAIAEFSRIYCVAICSVLVPINLIASLQTIIFVTLNRSKMQVCLMSVFASIYAVIMVLHVGSWLTIGVVRSQTFILLIFGSVCLSINTWAVCHPGSMRQLLRSIAFGFKQSFISLENSWASESRS